MRFYTSFTPRHWEIGVGFYKGCFYWSENSGNLTSKPSEIALLLGPFSVCLTFGYELEVLND